MIDFSNADLSILHGALLTEIDAMKTMRSKMQDGKMLAQTFVYSGKLDALRDRIKDELERQAEF